MRLATVIITYDRIDDAKVLMHSIRSLWIKETTLQNIDIYHVFDGDRSWYPKQTMETELIRTPNDGHMIGAGRMIDAGIEKIRLSGISYDYIIVCSADVFWSRPEYISKIIGEMDRKQAVIATSLWFYPYAYSTEFFILKSTFAFEIFPLNLKQHIQKHIHLSLRTALISSWPVLEELLYTRVKTCLEKIHDHRWKQFVLLIQNRTFVHLHNRYHSDLIGYSSFHSKLKKQKVIETVLGEQVNKSL